MNYVYCTAKWEISLLIKGSKNVKSEKIAKYNEKRSSGRISIVYFFLIRNQWFIIELFSLKNTNDIMFADQSVFCFMSKLLIYPEQI